MNFSHLRTAYLNVVVPVIMEVEDPVDLTVSADMKVLNGLDTLTYSLARILLHLDVVELSATTAIQY